MRSDHEEIILRNPALGACAFWHLAAKYAEHSDGEATVLPHFLIGSGMIFHRTTIEKIRQMWFDSGVLKAVAEEPIILAGLQGRVGQYHLAALKALQLGVSSGLLLRDGGYGFPAFRAVGGDLPKALREAQVDCADIFAGAKRLGAWFAMEPIEVLSRQLNIEF